MEKEGRRCEGRGERGRAREKGAGSGLPAAERTALKTPAGCGPPAAPPRIPDPRLQGRPLPGSFEGPSPAGSVPARPRRRVPGAQPRADPSGRRGSAAGLSGPGENKGARRRGRGKEAPPAEERGGSVPRGRGEPSLRPSPASPACAAGAGAALPGRRAHTDAPLLPGRTRSAQLGTRAGGRPGHGGRPGPQS